MIPYKCPKCMAKASPHRDDEWECGSSPGYQSVRCGERAELAQAKAKIAELEKMLQGWAEQDIRRLRDIGMLTDYVSQLIGQGMKPAPHIAALYIHNPALREISKL